MEKANVVLFDNTLAEAYSVRTMANYLYSQQAAGAFNHKLSIGSRLRGPASQKAISGYCFSSSNESDLTVGAYSGVDSDNDLSFDIAILKNCVIPVSNEQKQNSRLKYKISNDQKTFISSYNYALNKPYLSYDCSVDQNLSLANLTSDLTNYSKVFLVDARSELTDKINSDSLKKISLINERGVLKEIYSIADVSMVAGRCGLVNGDLNNFIEATENGVFFCVPQKADWNYFGFKSLVEIGSIKTFDSFKKLESAVLDYIKKPFDNSEVLLRRAQHLKSTRDTYLPVLKKVVLACAKKNPKLEGISNELKSLDLKGLKMKQLVTGQLVVHHPKSNWRMPDGIDYNSLPPPII